MKRILCIAALLASFASRGADIFGFEIGKPLTLPECAVQIATPQGNKIYFAAQNVTCLEDRPNHGEPWRAVLRFSPTDAPSFVKDHEAYPVLSRGVLIGLDFETYGIKYQDAAFAEIQQKYGKPTKTIKLQEQNALGASFAVIHAQWHLTGIIVAFNGADGAFDEGSVSIDTPASANARTAWEQAKNKGKSL